MVNTLYFNSALSVHSSQLVGRLTLVCGSVLQVSVLDGQRHQIFVDRHDTLCSGLDLRAVLKPSHQQPHHLSLFANVNKEFK